MTCLNDDILHFLLDNNVSICTSLDGTREIHNYNRPYKLSKIGSFDDVIDKIAYLKSKGVNVGAIQTTSKKSIQNPKEIIDMYLKIGINHIFLRPLTPLGMADDSWKKVGYTVEEYINFYKEAFQYIMELNKNGTFFVETHAAYFLCKILENYSQNYMELRSPCGGAIGQMAYYYDGNIYTCDEGRMLSEMGNDSFKLGNVMKNTYKDLMKCDCTKAMCVSSCIECLPYCSNCVYMPYCGTCPVINLAQDNNIFARKPKEFRCKVYGGILDTLFDYIENAGTEKGILESWIKQTA